MIKTYLAFGHLGRLCYAHNAINDDVEAAACHKRQRRGCSDGTLRIGRTEQYVRMGLNEFSSGVSSGPLEQWGVFGHFH
jgi:hypothetical protein